MKVKELMEQLSHYAPDAYVYRMTDGELCTGVHKIIPSKWCSTTSEGKTCHSVIIE